MNLREWWRPNLEVKAFVADLNGVAYSSYTNQRLWIRTGNVILAAIVWALLTDHVSRLDGLTGFLAVWCGYLLGKSGVTGLARYGKSKTAVPYVEAQERGKATAPPTLHAETIEKVELKAPAPLTKGAHPEHEWAHTRTDDERGVP